MRIVNEASLAAQDRRLTLAAESDPDSPPLTDEQLRQFRPAREMPPLIFGAEGAARLLGKPAPAPTVTPQAPRAVS